MGQAYSQEFLSPREPNTALVGIALASMLFNSVENGVFRWGNFYGNMFLIMCTTISTGCDVSLHMPELGAKLGLVSAGFFTFGPHLKITYFSRLFPTPVRYGIGGFYFAYHGLALYRCKYHFEDAMEDVDEEKF